MYITNVKSGAIPEMVANLPFIDMNVPILALFKLLRVNTRAEAFEMIVGDLDAEESRLLCSVLDNDTTCDMSYDDLLEWLGRDGTKEPTRERRLRYLEHIITNEILPHMGLTMSDDVNRSKACYLGFMVRKLINTYTGQLQCDDRDHYANKRIETAGMLMSLLFRQVYRTQLKTLTSQMHRQLEQNKLAFSNVSEMINPKKITGAFKYAFSTGNWGMQRGNSTQTGVAQMLSRMTTVAALSNLRRINTPINREGKAPKPRQLHYTSWGIVCPVETPEGTSCGLIKNLAMMAHVRIGTYSTAVKEQLESVRDVPLIKLLDASNSHRARGIPVVVNGTLHMYTPSKQDALRLLERMRGMRRRSMLPFDTSISFVDNSVCIDTDPGCLLRPVLVRSEMRNVRRYIREAPSYEQLWEYLLARGAIEYVDKQEEIDLRIGLTPCSAEHFTHFELHPSLINGLCAALIPFPDHNQAPRNSYQSAMGKQAVGIVALNFPVRMDAIAHVLCSPQKPLVTTRMDEVLHTCEAPTGTNVIVVIMCYSGFNQEDSLVINRSALERGLFRSVKYQMYKDEERTNGADTEKFENPTTVQNCIGMRVGRYDSIGADGFLPIGTAVKAGDVIIGKTITTTEIGEGARRAVKRDRSVIVKHSDDAVVDAIMRSKNRDGSLLAKVRTRSTRTPIVGDKLSSRHGQKGVIGMVLDAADMPVTSDGLIPDIIVNPHAIPSRMTIGQVSNKRERSARRHPPTPRPHSREKKARALADDGVPPRQAVLHRGIAGRRDALSWGVDRADQRRARRARLRPARQRARVQRHDGNAHARQGLHRPDVLPAPQAHGDGQDALARARPGADPDAPARGGPRARGRSALRRDGARLVRARAAPGTPVHSRPPRRLTRPRTSLPAQHHLARRGQRAQRASLRAVGSLHRDGVRKVRPARAAGGGQDHRAQQEALLQGLRHEQHRARRAHAVRLQAPAAGAHGDEHRRAAERRPRTVDRGRRPRDARAQGRERAGQSGGGARRRR